MRIAITGSYGAGKSTLARALSETLGRRIHSIPAMADPWWKPDRGATACSRSELMELLIRRLMDRAAMEFREATVVSDGSLIHDWVFVRTLLMHGATPNPDIAADPVWLIESLEPARRAIHTRMHELYDVIIHLPVEFPLRPGIQLVSEEFRRLSDVYLLRELSGTTTPVQTVTGPLSARIEKCVQLVHLGRPSIMNGGK
jgi:nicotinamide riboside kinase